MPDDQLVLTGDASSLDRALDIAVQGFLRYNESVKQISQASIALDKDTKKIEGSVSGLVGKNRELTTSFEVLGNKYKITGQEINNVVKQQGEAISRLSAEERQRAKEQSQAHALRMRQLQAEVEASRATRAKATEGTQDTKFMREELALETERVRLAQIRAKQRQQATAKELADAELLLQKAKRLEANASRAHAKLMQESRERISAAEREGKSAAEITRLKAQQQRLDTIAATQEANNATKREIADKRHIENLKRAEIAQQRLNNQLLNQGKNVQQLGVSFSALFRILTITTAYRAFFEFTNQIKQGISNAIDFQRAVAGVQTISQDSALTTNEWADGLQRVSDGWRLDILEQTEAAYQTLTNQVAKGAEVFGFLEQANRFATAALVDTNEAVRIGAAAINAYGYEADEASRIFASFFKTIELGRLRGGELTEIGRILLPAKQLGISLDEVNAAMSTLTIQGVKANEAMTFIRGIFQKMIKPTEKMKDLFEELGVESGDAAIQTFGFGGFLQILEDRFKGSSGELGDLFNRVRALAGIFGLSGRALDAYNENLDKITGSTDSFNRAVDIVQATAGEKLTIAMSKVTNVFVRAGESFLNTASDLTGGFAGFDTVARSVVILIKAAVIPAVVALTGVVILLGNAIIKTPFGLILTALSAATTAYLYLASTAERSQERIRAAVAESSRKFYEANQDRLDEELKLREAQRRTLEESFRGVNKNLAASLALANTTFGLQTKLLGKTREDLKDFGDEVKKVLANSVKAGEKAIKDLEDVANSAVDRILDLTRSVDNTLFDWELEEAKGQDALNLILDRIKKLNKEADAVSLDPTKFDLLKTLQDEALQLQKQYKQLQDKIIADNKKVQQDRLDNAREYAEEELKLQNAIAEARLKLAKATKPEDRLKARNDLNEKERELIELGRSAQQTAAGLVTQTIAERDAVQDIVNLRDRQIKQLETITLKAKEQAAEEAKTLANTLAQQARFEQIIKTLTETSVKDVLDLGKPDLIVKQLETQKKATEELLTLADKLGVEYSNISDIRQSSLELDKTVRLQLLKEEVKLAQQKTQEAEKQLKFTAENAQKEQSAAKSRVEDLKANANAIATVIKESRVNDPFQVAARDFLRANAPVSDTVGGPVLEDAQRALEKLRSTLAQIATGTPEEIKAILSGEYGKNLGIYLSRISGNLPEEAKSTELRKLIESLAQDSEDKPAILGDVETSQTILDLIKETVEVSKGLLTGDEQKAESEKIAAGLSTQAQAVWDLRKAMLELKKAAEDAANAQRKVIGLEGIKSGIQSELSQRAGSGAGFANGGSVGHDSIRAMLSPGEMVMNRAATNKMFSQLVGMNSGFNKSSPSGSSISVGDISVNVSSTGNNTIDAIGIGKALRREIQRGTVRLQ